MLSEKVLQLKLLPRTPSAFQQARRTVLPRFVLLGLPAIFSDEEYDGFQEDERPLWVGMRWMRAANESAAHISREEENLGGQIYPRAGMAGLQLV